MPNWLQRLAQRVARPVAAGDVFVDAIAPDFSTRLAVDSPGAPGMAGAEALYQKWAARWQEF